MGLRSFGKITVAAAGTPVRVTVNESDPTKQVKVKFVTVSALAANTGAAMYLGEATMNKTTLQGVHAICYKGTLTSAGNPAAPDPICVSDLYLLADSDGDAALVSAVEE